MPSRALKHRFVWALVLLVAPAIASAQIGVGGGIGGMGRRGGIGGGMGGGRAGGGMQGGRVADAPVINSVDLVLRHFHDLALSDTQVTQLTVVKARQDSLILPIRARLDSLVPPGQWAEGGEIIDGPTSDRLLARREAMKAYREVLREGRSEAFTVLEKKQRKKAEKLESDIRKELQESGPRGRRGGFGDP
jgi:hypothetical protein